MSCSKSITREQKEGQAIASDWFFSGEEGGQLLQWHDAICLLGSGVYLASFLRVVIHPGPVLCNLTFFLGLFFSNKIMKLKDKCSQVERFLLNIPRRSAYGANHRHKIWHLAAKCDLIHSIVILICGHLLKSLRKNNSEPHHHVHVGIVYIVTIVDRVKIGKQHKRPAMRT